MTARDKIDRELRRLRSMLRTSIVGVMDYDIDHRPGVGYVVERVETDGSEVWRIDEFECQTADEVRAWINGASLVADHFGVRR